jgi:hypothetical protein
MYYFDNRLLGHYLATGVDVKVFINGVYYTLASSEDVANPVIGYGYDFNGKTYEFDYRGIEHILINGVPIDMEQLEKAFKGGDEKGKGDKGEEKTDDKEAKKEESFKVGEYVQNIDPTNSAFKTKGSIVLVENDFVTYEYYSDEGKRITRKTVPVHMLKKID